MLQTINGLDFLLFIITIGLAVIVAIQKQALKDLRANLYSLVQETNRLAWALETERQADLYVDTDCPDCGRTYGSSIRNACGYCKDI